VEKMRVENLKKSYGERKVLDGISFEGEEGKVTVILGESGCGKSTLLGILSKNIDDYSGEINFDRDINSIYFKKILLSLGKQYMKI
jgi:NitT/TauT family transport system ATP-binding protein